METFSNQFSLLKQSIAALPQEEQGKRLTQFVQQFVKFLGTCDMQILQWDYDACHLVLPNQSRVQNHIGGIQACALILVAESAMALQMAANLPDGKIAVSKKVCTDFLKKAKTHVSAFTSLDNDQIQQIRTLEKGEMRLKTEIKDENQETVAICEATWVWK